MEETELTTLANKQIRRIFHQDEWWFSVTDVIAILTESSIAKRYWTDLKRKLLQDEGFTEVYEKIVQLKLPASDGKKYATDCANVETLLRIIQSIPSPKAEPIKQWLAKVGHERLQETADPEQSLNRARENWLKNGYSPEWIQRRMMGQEIRNKLTDYWQTHDIQKGDEFAILTNIIHQEWTGLTVKQHKDLKRLKQQNLRDHMTDTELVLTSLAELSTKQIAEANQARGLEANKVASKQGGVIAKHAKLELEQQTGKQVISSSNHLDSKPVPKTIQAKAKKATKNLHN